MTERTRSRRRTTRGTNGTAAPEETTLPAIPESVEVPPDLVAFIQETVRAEIPEVSPALIAAVELAITKVGTTLPVGLVNAIFSFQGQMEELAQARAQAQEYNIEREMLRLRLQRALADIAALQEENKRLAAESDGWQAKYHEATDVVRRVEEKLATQADQVADLIDRMGRVENRRRFWERTPR